MRWAAVGGGLAAAAAALAVLLDPANVREYLTDKSANLYFKYKTIGRTYLDPDPPCPWCAAAMSPQDLRERIGVNVHMSYRTTPYWRSDQVIGALQYLNLDHVRDMGVSQMATAPGYERLAAAGYRLDLILQGDLSPLAEIEALSRRHPGAVAALEGPNEINNFPVSYAGRTGRPAAVAFQAAMARAVRSSAAISTTPIYMFTGYPAGVLADVTNLHSYPRQGQNPAAQLRIDLETASRGRPQQPFVVTETGYATPVAGGADRLSEQARDCLVSVLEAVRLGARRVYLYELFDEAKDGDRPDPENHFGLFDVNGRPKPAAVALRSMLRILLDRPDAAAPTAAPSARAIIPRVAAPGVRMLRMAGGRSDNRIILWSDSRAASGRSAAVVDLGRSYPHVRLYRPVTQGDIPVRLNDARYISVDLAQGPAIVAPDSERQPAPPASAGVTVPPPPHSRPRP